MSFSSMLPARPRESSVEILRPHSRVRRTFPAPMPLKLSADPTDYEATPQRQAELFYLQKQIQSQTPMVVVLEDGEHIEGCIEWYDRNAIKVRGRSKVLIYKSAIKYMYKLGDTGPQ
jgi:sRNA-binding regulator protein Hfq